MIYTSSATVYGAHPDNDVPLTEDSPLRANLDFSYPAHKLETEYVVREVREEYPDLEGHDVPAGDRVRPQRRQRVVAPPGAADLVGVQGHTPPMQFVHEDDVGDALVFAVFEDLDGPYNLAAEGGSTGTTWSRSVGKRQVSLPEPIAFQVSERLWNLGFAEAPAGMLHYVMHPWVMSVDKLAGAGFKAQRSNRETFAATVERTSTKVRFGRTRVDKGQLKLGALAGAGLLAGLLVWRGAKRASA